MRGLGLIPQPVDPVTAGAHPVRDTVLTIRDRLMPVYDVKGQQQLRDDMQHLTPAQDQHAPPVSVPADATRPTATFQHKQSRVVTFAKPDRTPQLNSDNWRVNGSVFRELQDLSGKPFTMDACCEDDGSNAWVRDNYCSPRKRSFLTTDCVEQHVWLNPPYSNVSPFLEAFERNRLCSPSTTSGVILLPDWTVRSWEPYLANWGLLKHYPAGSHVFSAPTTDNPTVFESVGPTRWPVNAWYAGPSTVPSRLGGEKPPTSTTSQLHALFGRLPRQTPAELHHVTNQQEPTDMVTLAGHLDNVPTSCLIDSGASDNFIDEAWAHQHHLPVAAIPPADRRKVRLANGDVTRVAGKVTCTMTCGQWSSTVQFQVLQLTPQRPVILGVPWLRQHNPHIEWSTGAVTINGYTLPSTEVKDREVQLRTISAAQMLELLKGKTRSSRKYKFFYGTLRGLRDTLTQELNRVGDAPASAGSFKNAAEILNPTEQEIRQIKTSMSPANEHRLHELLLKYQSLTEPPTGLPPYRGIDEELRIQLKEGAVPPRVKTWRMSPAEMKELKEQLDAYIAKGFIRPSSSEWGSPVLFARKADGSLRMCIDYRALNALTVKDKYPIPRIDDLMDTLRGASVFTLMDLSQGFHHIRIKEEDIPKTAFNTRYGQYEWTVMPFGLSNAPSTMQRMVNKIFRDCTDKFMCVYIDDIMVYSRNEEEHLRHLEFVLARMEEYHLKVRFSKCYFARSELDFLGYKISAEGLRPTDEKVKKVREWPPPKKLNELRQFLGFVNFYRKFIPNYSEVAKPLHDLTKKDAVYDWKQPQQRSFEQLRDTLCAEPLLVIPQTGPDARFALSTDASGYGIGAILLQDQGKGLQPVEYYARSMNDAERRYPVHEQELLAVVAALRHWRHYLHGCAHFLVLTDHSTLKHFMTQQTQLSNRQASWLQTVQQFANNMTIYYRRGDENPGDGLSRRPDFVAPPKHQQEVLTLAALWTAPPQQVAAELGALTILQPDAKLKSDIEEGQRKVTDWSSYSVAERADDGLYRVAGRLVVPNFKELRRRILEHFHDELGHFGVVRLSAHVKHYYYWKYMDRDIQHFCATCSVCQRIKSDHRKKPGLLQPLPVPNRPWEVVGMDYVTQLPDSNGYNAVLTFTDLYSKMVHLVPTTTDVTAEQTAKLFLHNVYRLHGLPRVFVSDRDSKFTSQFWRSFTSLVNTRLNMSTAYRPQTDGQAERTNQLMEQVLRAYCYQRHDLWMEHLDAAEFYINLHKNASTGFSPFEVVYGRQPDTPGTLPISEGEHVTKDLDLWREREAIHQLVKINLIEAKLFQQHYANKKLRDDKFAVGDRVAVDTEGIKLAGQPSKAFRQRFAGPMTVQAVLNPQVYRLQLPSAYRRLHPVFHISKLRHWRDDHTYPDRFVNEQQAGLHADVARGEYLVEEVLDHRLAPIEGAGHRGPTLQFLIRWAGYDADHDTWESYNTVKQLAALDDYLQTPGWLRFAATNEYKNYARSNRQRVPRPIATDAASTATAGPTTTPMPTRRAGRLRRPRA